MEKTGIAEERFENKNLKYNIFSFCVLRFKFSCCSLSTAFGYKERTLLELGINWLCGETILTKSHFSTKYAIKTLMETVTLLWAKLVVQFFFCNIYGLQPVYGISSLNFKFSKTFINEKSCKWLLKSDCLPCNLRQAVKKVDIFKYCNIFDKRFLWNLSWHNLKIKKCFGLFSRRKSVVLWPAT